MAHLTRFCIDHHAEIFGIPTSICTKLTQGGAEPERNKENTMTSPIRTFRQVEDSVAPPKHKKIAELIDGDTPRKKTKVESPSKSPSSKSPRRLRRSHDTKQRGQHHLPVSLRAHAND